jgi:hypothetical protein
MEPTKEIETTLIQAKKYLLFLWPYMVGGMRLTVWSITRNAPFYPSRGDCIHPACKIAAHSLST